MTPKDLYNIYKNKEYDMFYRIGIWKKVNELKSGSMTTQVVLSVIIIFR
jgi:hypothetical protein